MELHSQFQQEYKNRYLNALYSNNEVAIKLAFIAIDNLHMLEAIPIIKEVLIRRKLSDNLRTFALHVLNELEEQQVV